MSKEARINTGIAKAQRFTIDPDRSVLKGADKVLGRIHELIEIATMEPAPAFRDGDEYFQRRVSCTGTHSRETGVDADRARLNRRNGVGDAKRQVVMGVYSTS